jgi:pyruvate kinase
VVSKKTDKVVYTKVVEGGELSNNKSINIPSVELNMEYLSDIDKDDIAFGVEENVDCYAISFVNHAKDVDDVRAYLHDLGVDNSFIISKIESAKGVDNMEEIIKASDGVMVARGDMGVEIPFERLPHIQKDMLRMCKDYGKYSITATQMLETMVSNTRPTRAEISDVANAIYDGSCAIMLSGETSAGKYPVLAVKTMQKIATETEGTIDYQHTLKGCMPVDNVTCGIGYAACSLANSLNAKAILVTTTTGYSAASISRFRPGCDIVALTPNYDVYFKLGMFWGVTPLLDKMYYDTDELLKSARERALQAKCVESGDVVIQTAGIMTCVSGSNMLVVSEIE